MSVRLIPPYSPHLYSKTGVSRGIPIFRIFAPKHRLWVLVNRLTEAVLTCTTIYVLNKKKKKNINFFSAENFQFLQL